MGSTLRRDGLDGIDCGLLWRTFIEAGPPTEHYLATIAVHLGEALLETGHVEPARRLARAGLEVLPDSSGDAASHAPGTRPALESLLVRDAQRPRH